MCTVLKLMFIVKYIYWICTQPAFIFLLQISDVHLSNPKMQTTPLEVTLQAGEFEVFKSIFQTSIPYILGWNTTMDIASAAAMSKGMNGGGNQY